MCFLQNLFSCLFWLTDTPSYPPTEGVPALVDLLKIDNEELQCVAASVLCNISEQDAVRQVTQ